MSGLLNLAREILRKAYSPTVLVFGSPQCNEMLETVCSASLCELLQAYSDVSDEYCVRFVTLDALESIRYPTRLADAGDGGSAFEAAALATSSLKPSSSSSSSSALSTPGQLTAAGAAAGSSIRPAVRFEAFRRELGRESFVSPWYVSYAIDFVSGFGASTYDFNSHPSACIVSTTTDDPDPIATLAQLYVAQQPPKLFTDKQIDPQLVTFYVLIHRAAAGSAESERFKRASTLLSALKTTFGAKNVVMLVIKADVTNNNTTTNNSNSNSSNNDSTAVVDESDVGAKKPKRLKKKKDSSSTAAATASSSSTTTATLVRSFSDVLAPSDIVQLRQFLVEVVQTGILAPCRSVCAALAENVAQKRSKISSLRGWLSG